MTRGFRFPSGSTIVFSVGSLIVLIPFYIILYSWQSVYLFWFWILWYYNNGIITLPFRPQLFIKRAERVFISRSLRILRIYTVLIRSAQIFDCIIVLKIMFYIIMYYVRIRVFTGCLKTTGIRGGCAYNTLDNTFFL